MTFKEYFYNIYLPILITEDYESNINQITKIIKNNNLNPSTINIILDIYNNVRVDQGRETAKNDADLIALTYIYLSNQLNDNAISQLYSSYLNSATSVNKKLLSKYFVELQHEIKVNGLFKPNKQEEKSALLTSKTRELIEDIHRYQKKEKFNGNIADEKNDKVYEDSKIVVYQADTKAKCIYYGRDSSLCISTKSGNYYWKYRMGKMRSDNLGMTTYFVYWKNNNQRILIDSLGDEDGSANQYSWNPISPNTDRDISKDDLVNKFPDLIEPFKQNIFKFIPYAEREKRFEWIETNVHSMSSTELNSYEDYEMALQSENIVMTITDWDIVLKKINDQEAKQLLSLAAELSKLIPKNLQNKYFTEKQIARYENNIAKDAESAYNYAKYILKGNDVPEFILQSIAKDSRYAYNYVNYVLKGKDVPEIILQSIAKDSRYAYNYAKYILKGNDVPEIILQSIAKDAEYAYNYAEDVSQKGKDVPEIILQGIANNAEYAYLYAKDVLKGNDVPEIILQVIAKDSRYAYYYANHVLKGNDVPEIILQSITKDSGYAYYYAKDVLKGNDVPEFILQSIAKNASYAYNYANDALKGNDVPEIILQGIAKNASYAYNYAEDVLKRGKDVPEIILQVIAKDSRYAYNYAKDVLKGNDVPEIILQGIAKDPTYAYDYAKDVLKGKDVPEIILQSIAKDAEYARQPLVSESSIMSLSQQIIRANVNDMEEIENRNFTTDYSADSDSIIADSNLKGFIGEGIFNDLGKLVGYGYGYSMGADDEYDALEYIDIKNVTFFDKQLKEDVYKKGIKNICTPENTFYFSNLVVDKPYRLYVKRLLNTLLDKIRNTGYQYIVFDGLSDTLRLFDSPRKTSRLVGNNLNKLAEIADDDSKLVLFQFS